ncbi:hypothetical protein ASH09_11260 [Agrobacterium radiobacter]|nr:hypothetical protein ASH09_11260 [Agrobacterium radiobacter]
MCADALARKILVRNHLVRQISAISFRNQSLSEDTEPLWQWPEIGIWGNSARFIVVAITEMLHTALQLSAPSTVIQYGCEGGFVFGGDESVEIHDAWRQRRCTDMIY